MNELKQLTSVIKDRLNQQTTGEIISFIGFHVNRNHKFSLRDENTPSCSIRRDGFIKDFGGEFAGDLIDLLQQSNGLSFKDSVLYIADCLGVDHAA